MNTSGEGIDRRVAVLFEGHVQGVGFRMTAVTIAQRFAVVGFVKNEQDGSVQLVAEGDELELMQFLDALRASHVGRYIGQERVNWSAARGEFSGFTIRYG